MNTEITNFISYLYRWSLWNKKSIVIDDAEYARHLRVNVIVVRNEIEEFPGLVSGWQWKIEKV